MEIRRADVYLGRTLITTIIGVRAFGAVSIGCQSLMAFAPQAQQRAQHMRRLVRFVRLWVHRGIHP